MSEYDVGIISFLSSAKMQFHGVFAENLLVSRNMLLLGKAYGLRIGLFSTDDFICRDGIAVGRACSMDDGRISWENASFPALLENIYSLSQKVLEHVPADFSAWLKTRTLLNGPSLSKERVSLALMRNGYGAYMIPTTPIACFEELRTAMQLWKCCVVKPANGRQGLGVSYLDKKGDDIYYLNTQGSGLLTEESWNKLCARFPEFTKYLLQPRLNFHCADGHALDFRLLVSKGGSGDWETVAIYARIGAGSIVSNVSRGGYIGDAYDVLQGEFPQAADTLMDSLNMLANKVPRIISSYCKEPVSCYGIDVGIDRDSLSPYVIEDNTFPGTHYHTWQLAEKRVQYFKYLLEHPQDSL